MTLRGRAAFKSSVHVVASGMGVALLSVMGGAEGRAQVVLDTIEVQGSGAGANDPQSAYGPGQGYVASRSAAGTKTDTPISEIPQSISVVTSEAIRDQGATTVQEALRYVPGTYADAYGPDTRSDGELVRGTTPVTYLDGLRLLNGGYWNQTRPDPFTLSRIEVLRGPGSVLFGDSPSGGLINLVTKRPQEQEHREIGLQYGSFNR